MNTINFLQDEDSYIQHKHRLIKDSSERIAPGIYSISDVGGMGETIFKYSPLKQEERLIEFESGTIGDILSVIPAFLSDTCRQVYSEMGATHKLGVLLHGKPGMGKTVSAMMLMNRMVRNYGAVALICTGRPPKFSIKAAEYIRTVQDSPIIMFWDEFDNLTDNCEHDLLNFLDGTDSINGCIVIGCTNHIDRIPDRIKNRKSRIKYVYEVSSFPIEVYRRFITEKCPVLSADVVSELSYKSEANGLTLDQVKHALIDYRVNGTPVDECIQSVTKSV